MLARLQRPWPGRPAFWLLTAVVLLAHLLLGQQLAEDRVGWGAGDAPPPRIEVAFVRELAAAKPPPVAAPVAVAEPRLAAVATAPAAAASAPALVASEPAPEPVPVPEPGPTPAVASAGDTTAPPPVLALAEPDAPLPLPPTLAAPEPDSRASAAAAAALGPSPALAVPDALPPLAAQAPTSAPAPASASTTAAAAASAPPVAFAWPPSTRLSYKLLGNYRGPVEGTAQVDWLRQGSRYQVHLFTAIGPVLSRRISSEGELTAQGLAPRRFDGEQKVLFRAARRWQLRFGPEQVLLSDGKDVPTQPGVQDEASQFVQLTWLFTTQPDKLRVGGAVDMPLAISRKLERWTYDVVGEELLRFPFGDVATFHLKPRRAATGGDLSAEIWIAPTLQYLPVRIRITDGKDSWVDLTLEKAPMQAAATR